MKLKISPSITARYWTAIMIASMCGTNLGDLFLEYLKLNAFVSLSIWALALASLFAVDRISKKRSESFYWCAILIVRAAATNIADYLVKTAHLSYLQAAVIFASLLIVLVAVTQRRSVAAQGHADAIPSKVLPPTNKLYWLTMLMAGTLGTVVGDGMKHAFGTSDAGIPIATALATLSVILTLLIRQRSRNPAPALYWLAVVAVRWWGTNTGDWLADQISLISSLLITALCLAGTLIMWRERVDKVDLVDSKNS